MTGSRRASSDYLGEVPGDAILEALGEGLNDALGDGSARGEDRHSRGGWRRGYRLAAPLPECWVRISTQGGGRGHGATYAPHPPLEGKTSAIKRGEIARHLPSHGLRRVPTPEGSPGVSRVAAFLPWSSTLAPGQFGYLPWSVAGFVAGNLYSIPAIPAASCLSCGNGLISIPADYPPTTRNYPHLSPPLRVVGGIRPIDLRVVEGSAGNSLTSGFTQICGYCGYCGYRQAACPTAGQSGYPLWSVPGFMPETCLRNPGEPREPGLTRRYTVLPNPGTNPVEPRRTPGTGGVRRGSELSARGSERNGKHLLTCDAGVQRGFRGSFGHSLYASQRSSTFGSQIEPASSPRRFGHSPCMSSAVRSGNPQRNPAEPRKHRLNSENMLFLNPAGNPAEPRKTPQPCGVRRGSDTSLRGSEWRQETSSDLRFAGFGGVRGVRLVVLYTRYSEVLRSVTGRRATGEPRGETSRSSQPAVDQHERPVSKLAKPRHSSQSPGHLLYALRESSAHSHRAPTPAKSAGASRGFTAAGHETTPDATTAKPSRPGSTTPKEATPV